FGERLRKRGHVRARVDFREHEAVESRVAAEYGFEVGLVCGTDPHANFTIRVEFFREYVVNCRARLVLPAGRDRVFEVENHDIRPGIGGFSHHFRTVSRREEDASSGHNGRTTAAGLNLWPETADIMRFRNALQTDDIGGLAPRRLVVRIERLANVVP